MEREQPTTSRGVVILPLKYWLMIPQDELTLSEFATIVDIKQTTKSCWELTLPLFDNSALKIYVETDFDVFSEIPEKDSKITLFEENCITPLEVQEVVFLYLLDRIHN